MMTKVSLIDHFLDDERILYLHLNDKEIKDFIEKITFENDRDNILQNYQSKTKRLPNGFKRDYAVGMSSHEFMFHMDYDTSYHKSAITRKLKYLQTKKVECVYNSSVLCVMISIRRIILSYTKVTDLIRFMNVHCFTLKNYWSNGGFKWSDLSCEGRDFSDNHGQQRKMDNYYDTVKLLNIRNVQEYKPIALDLQKSEFTYEIKKDIIESIVMEYNPILDGIDSLFSDNQEIQVLGIHSEFIESLEDEKFKCNNLTDKIKQTKIAKEIKKINSSFHILLFGYKQPVWALFEEISFDCILLETSKNMEQMHSIIQNCKKFNYIYLNGMYINQSILKNPSQSEIE